MLHACGLVFVRIVWRLGLLDCRRGAYVILAWVKHMNVGNKRLLSGRPGKWERAAERTGQGSYRRNRIRLRINSASPPLAAARQSKFYLFQRLFQVFTCPNLPLLSFFLCLFLKTRLDGLGSQKLPRTIANLHRWASCLHTT